MCPPCVGTLWELGGRNTDVSLEVLSRVVLGRIMSSLGVPRKICILLGFSMSKLTYLTRERVWVNLINWKCKLVNLGFLADAGLWYSEASS